MTKREAYKRVFGKEAIHIEGIDDWDSDVDDEFWMELEVIKQMAEVEQNEITISKKDNGCCL